MLASGQAEAVAEKFLPGSGETLFKNAAELTAVDVPPQWPLPPPENDILKNLFVANGPCFHQEKVYWRSVLSFILERDLLIDEFKNIGQLTVEMNQSSADGALSRQKGKYLKLMAILEAGSKTAHPDKKVSPDLSLLFNGRSC